MMQLSRRLLRRSMLIGMWVAIPAWAQQGPPGGDPPERSTDPQEILENTLQQGLRIEVKYEGDERTSGAACEWIKVELVKTDHPSVPRTSR